MSINKWRTLKLWHSFVRIHVSSEACTIFDKQQKFIYVCHPMNYIDSTSKKHHNASQFRMLPTNTDSGSCKQACAIDCGTHTGISDKYQQRNATWHSHPNVPLYPIQFSYTMYISAASEHSMSVFVAHCTIVWDREQYFPFSTKQYSYIVRSKKSKMKNEALWEIVSWFRPSLSRSIFANHRRPRRYAQRYSSEHCS